MPSAEPFIELRGVHLIRDGHPIIRGVDWRVPAGQHWAVLGANGSGKTTLLRIVAGRFYPSRGEATVLGRRFGRADISCVWRGVGWVSSVVEQMIRPRLRALGVVLTGRTAGFAVYHEPSSEEIEEARRQLDAVGCGHVAERPYALLSQGEQMRVMIARALFGRPSILVLDEPCAGLDPVARESLLGWLDGLLRRPSAPAVVYVTHHIEEIVPGITHVLVLRRGRVAAAGPRQAVLTAETLERGFGVPFEVHREGERYTARPLIRETGAGPAWEGAS